MPQKFGRTYTLRGAVDFTGTDVQEIKLFSYEANDLKWGWVVEHAEIWIGSRTRSSSGAGTVDAPAFTNCSLQLQTDTIGANETLSAEDNRCFGWLQCGYQYSDAAPYNIVKAMDMNILDPEHMITREMWGNFQIAQTNNDEGNPMTLNYLIILRRKATDPKENILQQIKSVAQDIDN